MATIDCTLSITLANITVTGLTGGAATADIIFELSPRNTVPDIDPRQTQPELSFRNTVPDSGTR